MLRIKFTKLTLFLITLSFFISCSKTEDTKSESAFSPPSWIIGAWTDNVSSSFKSGFKFDSTDVYMIMFGQVIETGYVAAGVVTKHLTSTDSEFSYSSPVEGTSGDTNYSGTVTNVFTKETDSTMKLTGSSTTSYVSVTETTYTKDTSL
ncbi:uncharacterized protein METZ01_LOCUS444747 [marine metagenome]|uniref:Uncharacterized protein n=1 Tax=marine metagenome TaxID=408172 RepID=A0A382Z8V0_9ZZZZ